MNMKLDLNNAAYSEAYIKQCAELDELFVSENQIREHEITLSKGYYVLSSQFERIVGDVTENGSNSSLYNSEHKLVHQWRSYTFKDRLYKMIEHSDGNLYLFYRQELYGYSLFNITTGEAFQYYPQAALDEVETFIITDVMYYDPIHEMLVTSGCYWAAPYSVMLLDFASPLNTPRYQIDVRSKIENGYYDYDDIDFVGCSGDELKLHSPNIGRNDRIVLKLSKVLPQSV